LNTTAPVIEVDSVVTRFGAQTVHAGVTFSVARGQVAAMIGSSGSGKSVLVREIIGLLKPNRWDVRLLGTDVWTASAGELVALRHRFGMMFQDGALFSSSLWRKTSPGRCSSTPRFRHICCGLWCGCVSVSPVCRSMPPRRCRASSPAVRKRAAVARAAGARARGAVLGIFVRIDRQTGETDTQPHQRPQQMWRNRGVLEQRPGDVLRHSEGGEQRSILEHHSEAVAQCYQIPRPRRSTVGASRRTSPAVGFSNPMISRTSTDLPLPLLPIIAATCPRATLNVTPSCTVCAPKRVTTNRLR